MKTQKYVYLSPEDSKTIYPNNNSYDFTVILAAPLQLNSNFKVALTEIDFEGGSSLDLYIYSDVCGSSNVLGQNLPILRYTNKAREFQKLNYINVTRSFIDSIKIFIRDSSHNIPTDTLQNLKCSLVFKSS